MCTPHFEIQNGVLTKCRMSGEENMTVTIPDGVTSIGKNAFFDCGLLQSITIPDSVTSIGKKAFWGCDALKSITIPDSVISIGNKAFAVCTALESVTIPNGVINIGKYAFSGCNSLQRIDVSEGNANYFSCGGVLFDQSKSILIKYPEGKKDLSFTIPDGVTIVEKYAFNWSKSLKSIKIPDSITSIRCKAFDRCTSLKTIDVSESNTSYSSCNGILFDKAKKHLLNIRMGKKIHLISFLME